MRDNSEGGELDPAKGVRRCCKKNSPVLSYIGKRTKEGCDLGSSRRARRERASTSEETEGIWQKRVVKKISSPKYVSSLQ